MLTRLFWLFARIMTSDIRDRWLELFQVEIISHSAAMEEWTEKTE